jgi:HlyD family secretion protein
MRVSPERWSAARLLIIGFSTILMLLCGLGAWSVLTTLTGAIIAPGQIEVAQNRQVVQHLDGGVVAEINVTEGDVVRAGDILIQLDGTLLKSELSIVNNQLFELFARRARLEAERDNAAAVRLTSELRDAALERAEVQELADGQVKLFAARRHRCSDRTYRARTGRTAGPSGTGSCPGCQSAILGARICPVAR